MLFRFARVSATVGMSVRDYRPDHRVLRLFEKGGKPREIPVHRELGQSLDAYLAAARQPADAPLFPTLAGRTGKSTGGAMSRATRCG